MLPKLVECPNCMVEFDPLDESDDPVGQWCDYCYALDMDHYDSVDEWLGDPEDLAY